MMTMSIATKKIYEGGHNACKTDTTAVSMAGS